MQPQNVQQAPPAQATAVAGDAAIAQPQGILEPANGTRDGSDCPNSDDCAKGHPELRLEHLRQYRDYICTQKVIKAIWGPMIIAWIVVFGIGIHSVKAQARGEQGHSASTPYRLGLALVILSAVADSFAGFGAVLCAYGNNLREDDKRHPGSEICRESSWWVDSTWVNWVLFIACNILLFISGLLLSDWMNQAVHFPVH
ncbi:hypothetical protein ABW21_db0202422 [Orbilia brochopaga]|nr:hypothetical protein ABW21_db0202422 [Drechslerella brochopaga]